VVPDSACRLRASSGSLRPCEVDSYDWGALPAVANELAEALGNQAGPETGVLRHRSKPAQQLILPARTRVTSSAQPNRIHVPVTTAAKTSMPVQNPATVVAPYVISRGMEPHTFQSSRIVRLIGSLPNPGAQHGSDSQLSAFTAHSVPSTPSRIPYRAAVEWRKTPAPEPRVQDL
jgi:hypothetical protein